MNAALSTSGAFTLCVTDSSDSIRFDNLLFRADTVIKVSLTDLYALQRATQCCLFSNIWPLMMAGTSSYSCLALLQMQQNVCTLKCICGHKLACKELTWGSAGSTFSASTGFVRAIASCSEGQMLSIIAIVCDRPSRHDQLRPADWHEVLLISPI